MRVPKILFLFFAGAAMFLSSSLSAIENSEVVDTVFTYTQKYKYIKSEYNPKISLSNLESEYAKKSFINPLPEYIGYHTLQAMKNGDYDSWLEFWDEYFKLSLTKNDGASKNKNTRLSEWKNLFQTYDVVHLFSQVQVGKAQYTYVLLTFELSSKTEENNYYLSFGFAYDDVGRWRLSEKVKVHPVFADYIQKRIK